MSIPLVQSWLCDYDIDFSVLGTLILRTVSIIISCTVLATKMMKNGAGEMTTMTTLILK